MQERSVYISFFDAIVIGFVFLLSTSSHDVFTFKLVALIVEYLFIRLLYTVTPKIANYLIIYVVVGYCLTESISGFLQLLGIIRSNHSLFVCTGYFDNPGPFGGFLVVCISLFVAYYVKNAETHTTNMISKILLWVVVLVSIVAVIIIPATQSRSAILALGCSVLLLFVNTKRIRTKIKKIMNKYGIYIVLSISIIGVVAYCFKKPSADGRLFIDKICIKSDNGWNGVGIGYFGGAYGNAQADYFQKQIQEKGKDDLDWRSLSDHDRLTADCPDNAFNEYLFIDVVAGPLAMLLFVAVIVSAMAISFKRGSIWCYGLTSFAIFAMFSYPLHVWQFQVTLPILLAASISDGETNRFHKMAYNVALLSITFLISSIWIIREIPQIRQNRQAIAIWGIVETDYKLNEYEHVVNDCDSLFPFMKHDKGFLFAYGQSLNRTGNYEKSDSILRMGTEMSSDPMFWNVMGNNSLAMGRYREAEYRYKHAFYMVPNRLYPLYLLAKLYYEEGDTVRFLDMAERVESFIPKVESANTERLRNEIRELKEDYISE